MVGPLALGLPWGHHSRWVGNANAISSGIWGLTKMILPIFYLIFDQNEAQYRSCWMIMLPTQHDYANTF